MTKRTLTLYVDAENVEVAMARGVNLSQMFNEILEGELEAQPDTDEQLIKNLKAKKALLMTELRKIRKKCEKTERENRELKQELTKKEAEDEIVEIPLQ